MNGLYTLFLFWGIVSCSLRRPQIYYVSEGDFESLSSDPPRLLNAETTVLHTVDAGNEGLVNARPALCRLSPTSSLSRPF